MSDYCYRHDDVCPICFGMCSTRLPNCEHRMHDECKFQAAGLCPLCSATTFRKSLESRKFKFSHREGIAALKALDGLNPSAVPFFAQHWMGECLIRLYRTTNPTTLRAFPDIEPMKDADLLSVVWEFCAVRSRDYEKCRQMRVGFFNVHHCDKKCNEKTCTFVKICGVKCGESTPHVKEL